jgi:hypothetical protein
LTSHFVLSLSRRMKLTLNPYKDPLWNDFNSLIEQAVVHQKASLYSDLNEEMKWALAITALRENKTEILDANFSHFNQLVADVLATQGSFKSLRRLYDELVVTIIESKASQEAHVAYCIDSALEKEEDKQAFYAAYEQEEKGGFYAEDYSF